MWKRSTRRLAQHIPGYCPRLGNALTVGCPLEHRLIAFRLCRGRPQFAAMQMVRLCGRFACRLVAHGGTASAHRETLSPVARWALGLLDRPVFNDVSSIRWPLVFWLCAFWHCPGRLRGVSEAEERRDRRSPCVYCPRAGLPVRVQLPFKPAAVGPESAFSQRDPAWSPGPAGNACALWFTLIIPGAQALSASRG